MRVYLDGTQLGDETTSLTAALLLGAKAAEAAGRMVVEAIADGRALTQQELASPPEQAPFAELRLETAEPRSLFRGTLLDAADALEDAKATQAEAAELIQTGRTREAIEPLKAALTTWQTVRDILDQGAAVLGLDLPAMSFDADPTPLRFDEQASQLASHLVEVKRSLGSEDWSALSDVLAYDLDARAGDWQRMLRSLAEQVIGDDEGTGQA